MCKQKLGNLKKTSRFICLSCGKVILDGVQRARQREHLHIKDLYCYCEKKDVKSVEVRWCDTESEVREKIPEIKEILKL